LKNIDILNKINDISGLKIRENEPMSLHTSFKIGGTSDVFAVPESKDALKCLIKRAKEEQIPVTVIGAGSNLLVSDKGIRGITIKIATGLTKAYVKDDFIYADSGVSLAKIASLALKNSLTGFEFASGIPGTLGGAVYMNAGAYGGEMKDVVVKSEYLDEKANIKTIIGDSHEFGYRSSFFHSKDDLVILSSEIKLQKGDKKEIEEKMADLNQRRKDKQPLNFPSAGSAFKRPEGYFAAKLIEDAGLKGKSVGGAQVSEKHSGFIINTGSATAEDVLGLLRLVKETVFEKFGVILTPEIKFIGEK